MRSTSGILVVAALTLMAATVRAEGGPASTFANARRCDAIAVPPAGPRTAPHRADIASTIARWSAASLDGPVAIPATDRSFARQTSSRQRDRSTTRKIVGAAIGGVGGFFGGGFLGAAIEGDRCNCDDPGFVGFLIGAPVGAAAGAIVGWKFF